MRVSLGSRICIVLVSVSALVTLSQGFTPLSLSLSLSPQVGQCPRAASKRSLLKSSRRSRDEYSSSTSSSALSSLPFFASFATTTSTTTSSSSSTTTTTSSSSFSSDSDRDSATTATTTATATVPLPQAKALPLAIENNVDSAKPITSTDTEKDTVAVATATVAKVGENKKKKKKKTKEEAEDIPTAAKLVGAAAAAVIPTNTTSSVATRTNANIHAKENTFAKLPLTTTPTAVSKANVDVDVDHNQNQNQKHTKEEKGEPVENVLADTVADTIGDSSLTTKKEDKAQTLTQVLTQVLTADTVVDRSKPLSTETKAAVDTQSPRNSNSNTTSTAAVHVLLSTKTAVDTGKEKVEPSVSVAAVPGQSRADKLENTESKPAKEETKLFNQTAVVQGKVVSSPAVQATKSVAADTTSTLRNSASIAAAAVLEPKQDARENMTLATKPPQKKMANDAVKVVPVDTADSFTNKSSSSSSFSSSSSAVPAAVKVVTVDVNTNVSSVTAAPAVAIPGKQSVDAPIEPKLAEPTLSTRPAFLAATTTTSMNSDDANMTTTASIATVQVASTEKATLTQFTEKVEPTPLQPAFVATTATTVKAATNMSSTATTADADAAVKVSTAAKEVVTQTKEKVELTPAKPASTATTTTKTMNADANISSSSSSSPPLSLSSEPTTTPVVDKVTELAVAKVEPKNLATTTTIPSVTPKLPLYAFSEKVKSDVPMERATTTASASNNNDDDDDDDKNDDDDKDAQDTPSTSSQLQNSAAFVNNGPFAWMQPFLNVMGIQEGKSIHFGLLTLPPSTSTTSEQKSSTTVVASDVDNGTKAPARELVNINMPERKRRDLAGDVLLAVSGLYVVWASLLGDDGGLAGHWLRFATVVPLFLGIGYKTSAKKGLCNIAQAGLWDVDGTGMSKIENPDIAKAILNKVNSMNFENLLLAGIPVTAFALLDKAQSSALVTAALLFGALYAAGDKAPESKKGESAK